MSLAVKHRDKGVLVSAGKQGSVEITSFWMVTLVLGSKTIRRQEDASVPNARSLTFKNSVVKGTKILLRERERGKDGGSQIRIFMFAGVVSGYYSVTSRGFNSFMCKLGCCLSQFRLPSLDTTDCELQNRDAALTAWKLGSFRVWVWAYPGP